MLRRLDLAHGRTTHGRAFRRAACALGLAGGSIALSVSPAQAAAPVTITAAAEAGAHDAAATATLAGGSDPGGTVTFRVFGPGDDTCARSPLLTSTNPVTGLGDPRHATSDRFVLTAPGVYHVVATYNGDARNAPAGPTACADPNAALGFGSSSFAFSAQASAPVAVGGGVSDAATIASSSDPTGTMTFALFGPGESVCTGTPAFTSTRPVRGNGSYTSDVVTPTTPGLYRWVARYGGDTDDPTAATSCNDPAQQVEVKAAAASGPATQCTVPAATRAALAQRQAAYRQMLQRLGNGPLAARARGQLDQALTACR